MNKEEIDTAVQAIPHKVAQEFFESLNKEIQIIKQATPDYDLKPLEVAELMYNCLGTVIATYIHNLVEPALREYVASKLMFSLSGSIFKHVESLQATNSVETPSTETESA